MTAGDRLTIEGLSAGYGRHPCVHEVDLRVGAGEVVALVGPNGAGKTTLQRAVSGLIPATCGRVLIEGTPVLGRSRRELARRVAGLPSEESCVFPFTVRDVVAMGRHPWGAARATEDDPRVTAALERFELKELADRRVPTLSAGERQRVGLARVVAQDTPVLLLDEPTSHQDPGRRVRLLDDLAVHARTSGQALLVILHDLDHAQRVADRIALMQDGRLVAVGPPTHVLTPEQVERVFGVPVLRVPHPAGGPPLLVFEPAGPAEVDA